MMRKHPRQDMTKASLWMTKEEYNKVADLSGHLSINSFLMTAVRKAISTAEAERRKESPLGLAVPSASPPARAVDDSTNPPEAIPGGLESDGK